MADIKKMNIPLLDLTEQYKTIKSDVDEVLMKVVESQYFILSPEVGALEKEIAAYTDTAYSAGVASGTDAIILALKAAGIGPGDKVITTPFTFFATAESVSALGATPVFVDIEPDSFNIDPDKVEELLRTTNNEKRKTIKAIIPVHLYGQCANMERIMDIAERYGLKVIEDCAQAIGATRKGKKAGSFGTAGCLSFFPSKNLGGFGDGGMVISSDEAFINRVKRLRVHGSREQYVHEEIGFNSRLDSLQAAILRVKLRKLDTWLDGRRVVAKRYDLAFTGLPLVTPKIDDGNTHTYHQYTLLADERDRLMKYLNDNGVGSRIYYPIPMHLQPCYRDMGLKEGSYPISESVCKRALSIPVYPELTEEKIVYITDTVKKFYR
ncbi:MAG: DegT/DnrJ/EryC1/StrS family aminotransferase [Candidatus Omnitrophica bacterium]|nr:DegT/DnrJ/EryC1/StrS family aminotransferase [Candidatus Omnitrophota bacterium]MDD4012785.1 DegT/DnrJ/EryC1/StrS family aminotransferase [Candidatus Omnitrophota bacterium]